MSKILDGKPFQFITSIHVSPSFRSFCLCLLSYLSLSNMVKYGEQMSIHEIQSSSDSKSFFLNDN